MIELEAEQEAGAGGAPKWMATFADLMSLLMCFFVLLLSFSEMDVQKYKQVAGSMRDAFGVQNQVKAIGIPKGTSIIAQEFSAGRPTPTPLNVVQQQAVDNLKQSLDTGHAQRGEDSQKARDEEADAEMARQLLIAKLESLSEQTKADAARLEETLKEEIQDDKIDIESGFRSITVRIRENGSFPSGSAILNPAFIHVMARLRSVLGDIEGTISVEGHTDNIPISTAKFPSNWHLAASRALSVTHELLMEGTLDDNRFLVVGHADTKPQIDNDTRENRARNRRVEIVIHQGLSDELSAELRDLERSNPALLKMLGVEADKTINDGIPE